MEQRSRKPAKGAGAGLLAVGIAFMVLAFSGQPAMLGVGLVFLTLGVVFLARSHKEP
ncbi:hypothetical protein [Luteimonas sp. e5]